MSDEEFTFRDGERQIRFGRGMLVLVPEALAEGGFEEYVLLTTERALADAPPDLAAETVWAPSGAVPDVAAAWRRYPPPWPARRSHPFTACLPESRATGRPARRWRCATPTRWPRRPCRAWPPRP